MARLRIAHFSDTHVLSIKGTTLRQFLNKRFTGGVNLLFNRAKHYRVEVFEALLDAVIEAKPDHSLCTGDLVNLALAPEFERVNELLSSRFTDASLTLVPGNHDYYTKEAALAGDFEQTFHSYLPNELNLRVQDTHYPVSRIIGEVCVIGASTAIPTPSFMATGEIGEAQRKQIAQGISMARAQSLFPLLMLHHPLFPEPKRRLDQTRRLKDADELMALIDHPDCAPDLIIHGHNHEYKRQALPRSGAPVLQVGSASRSGRKRAEFHIYEIEDGQLKAVERHIHDPEQGLFIPHNESGEPIKVEERSA